MILLLGGTADTAPLATMLAEAGYEVLVSTATGIPLAAGDHPRIRRREGPLDKESLAALLTDLYIRAVIDAAHPYAEEVHANAREAAACTGLPYLAYLRPAAIPPDGGIIQARSHEEAADLAFGLGRPVLLTTGSRNLLPYAAAVERTGLRLVVRVLDTPASLRACLKAGIPSGNILSGRGPFSLEQNLETIRKFAIGTVVTKDGGEAGGAKAKLEAARRAGCALVVVCRPQTAPAGVFSSPDDLLSGLRAELSPEY